MSNWATPIWIGIGIVIAVVETIALLNKTEGDTLSEHVWNWLKVHQQSKKWTAWRLFVLFFMIWLTGHFVFGLWAG